MDANVKACNLQGDICAFQHAQALLQSVCLAHQGIVNVKRSKLTPEHVDMLTFLAKNLEQTDDINLLQDRVEISVLMV